MACILDHVLGVFAFVEGCINHDNNALSRQFGQEVLGYPCGKNIGIYI
ncbi:hypothetical protein NOC27_1851 [Nitrosococcus oceani AFC27]|nr:hypothetical protein NOC27_1851 [Nitrosococcus oceani AFC27]